MAAQWQHDGRPDRACLRRTAAGLAVVLAASVLVATTVAGPTHRAEASTQSGGEFIPLQVRLWDATASSASTASVPVAGKVGIPATGVSAVQVTVMALSWASDGWVNAWPNGGGTSAPTGSSVLAAAPGERTSNTAIIPLGDLGKIQLGQTAAGRIVLDVQGYFTVSADGGGYQPTTPTRIVDTRKSAHPTTQTGIPGGVKLAASTDATIQIEQRAGVPTAATAAFVNITLIDPVSEGYLYAWPAGSTQPPTSVARPDSNFSTGLALKLSSTVKVTIRSTSAVHVVIDVVGYFVPASDSVGTFTPLTGRLASVTPLAPKATRVIQVADLAGIPSGYTQGGGGTNAVVLNVTTNSSTAHAGWVDVTTYRPNGTPSWTTAMANDPDASDARSNMVTVGVEAGNAIVVKNTSAATIKLTVDIQGYYAVPILIHPECGVADGDRITSTYVTPFPGTDLAAGPSPATTEQPEVTAEAATERRNAAWSTLMKTLYLNLCITSVTLTGIEHTACPDRAADPSCSGRTTHRWYHTSPTLPGGAANSASRPLAPGGSEVDVVGSLLRAVDRLVVKVGGVDYDPDMTVVIGGRGDASPTADRFGLWSDSLGQVASDAQGAAWANAETGAYQALWSDVWASYPDLRKWISGWHFTPEPTRGVPTSNAATVAWTATQQRAFRSWMARTTTAMHQVAPGTRTQIAPSYIPGEDPATSWTPFLTGLVSGDLYTGSGTTREAGQGRIAVDTVEVQDRLWAYQRRTPGQLPLSGSSPAIPNYFQPARTLVNAINIANQAAFGTGDPKRSVMRLHSDVELFDEQNFSAPAPLSFVVAALKAEAPYVDGFSSYSAQVQWAWGSWQPWWIGDGFASARTIGNVYSSWAQTGALPTGVPTVSSVTAAQNAGDVAVTVSASDASLGPGDRGRGVLQVWVYRSTNGSPFRRIAVCFEDGFLIVNGCRGATNPMGFALRDVATWQVIDPQVQPGSTVSYQAQAVNLAGNVSPTSAASPPITVGAPAHGTQNWVAGRPYTRSSPAEPGHPDSGNLEATDGVRPTASATSASAMWHGFLQQTDTTFDLGTARQIGEVDVDVLHEPAPGTINAPAEIEVHVSDDGVTWRKWKQRVAPSAVDDTADWDFDLDQVRAAAWQPSLLPTSGSTPLTYRILGLPVATRFLRVRVVPTAWAFVAEIAAYPPTP